MPKQEWRRRRFLRIGGICGTGVAAGCLRLGGGDDNQTTAPTAKETSSGPTSAPQTSPSSPNSAAFTFEYRAQNKRVLIDCTNGGGILAGDLQVQSTIGQSVGWPDLGSTVATANDDLDEDATAILGESILNWESPVERDETIRLVYRGADSPITIGRYSPPGTTTVTTTVPTTESQTEMTTRQTTERRTTTQSPPQNTELVDDFESGDLESAWRSEFDEAATRSGEDGGRTAFTVQSNTVGEGSYALRGDRNLYSDGTSTILRDDFTLAQEGATIRFYLKLGPIQDGYERANIIRLMTDDPERGKYVVQIRQKPDDPSYPGYIASEKLSSIQRVEIKNISFDNNSIEEVTIGGEIVKRDVEFQTESSAVTGVRVLQGHYQQPTDIVVDEIVLARPS